MYTDAYKLYINRILPFLITLVFYVFVMASQFLKIKVFKL